MIGQYDFHRIYYLDVICIYSTIPSSNPLFLLTGHLRSKTLSLNTKGFLDHDRMIISFTPIFSSIEKTSPRVVVERINIAVIDTGCRCKANDHTIVI
jgi:hypothetical protein